MAPLLGERMEPSSLKAFLDTIAWSEIGAALLRKSDNGYNVIFGGALFRSYADHPRVKTYETHDEFVRDGKRQYTTAAGRYQILARIFDFYRKTLNLPDFSPASQDAIAVQLIKERGALKDIEGGYIERAIYRCASAWASFPRPGNVQPQHDIEDLLAIYAKAKATRKDMA